MTTLLRILRFSCLLLALALSGTPGRAQIDDSGSTIPPAQDQILGTRATIDPHSPDHIWLERGAEIRRAADWASPVIAIVDVRVQVPITDQQDDWLLVRYAGWKGWVHRTGERPVEPPPFTTAPDPDLLARAAGRLGLSAETTPTLGPFTLYTDVSEETLLKHLDAVAHDLLRAYQERYGLDPGGEALEAVVLFSSEADYRSFTSTKTESSGLAAGHATRGLAVVGVGELSREEVAAVLVHELTHLLNRRIFHDVEAPWLDEGMSNDLAYCKIKRRSGEIQLGTLGGRNVVIDTPVYLAGGESRVDREVRLEGPVAALSLLREDEELAPLHVLFDLNSAGFMNPVGLRRRYDQSTFLVRYLLDSEEPSLADGFKEYLQLLAKAEGEPPAVDLPTHLGIPPERLRAGFVKWLTSRRAR